MNDIGRAACAGENPVLFDVYRYPEAWVGLTYCAKCPVTQACIEQVRPSKSHFDGICGGVVWRNGYRVRTDNSTREDAIRRRERMQSVLGKADAVPEVDGIGAVCHDRPGHLLPGDGDDLHPGWDAEDDLRVVPEQETLW